MFLKNITYFFLRRAFFGGKQKIKKDINSDSFTTQVQTKSVSEHTTKVKIILPTQDKKQKFFGLLFFFFFFFSKQIYFSYLHFIYFVLFFFIPYLCFLTNIRFLSLIITLRKDLTGDKLLMTRTSRYFVLDSDFEVGARVNETM